MTLHTTTIITWFPSLTHSGLLLVPKKEPIWAWIWAWATQYKTAKSRNLIIVQRNFSWSDWKDLFLSWGLKSDWEVWETIGTGIAAKRLKILINTILFVFKVWLSEKYKVRMGIIGIISAFMVWIQSVCRAILGFEDFSGEFQANFLLTPSMLFGTNLQRARPTDSS